VAIGVVAPGDLRIVKGEYCAHVDSQKPFTTKDTKDTKEYKIRIDATPVSSNVSEVSHALQSSIRDS
jgi:hypothetical protein